MKKAEEEKEAKEDHVDEEADHWAQKADEMRQLLAKLKEKGFVADDKAARQHMKKMGRFNRGVMDMLFGQHK